MLKIYVEIKFEILSVTMHFKDKKRFKKKNFN